MKDTYYFHLANENWIKATGTAADINRLFKLLDKLGGVQGWYAEKLYKADQALNPSLLPPPDSVLAIN